MKPLNDKVFPKVLFRQMMFSEPLSGLQFAKAEVLDIVLQ